MSFDTIEPQNIHHLSCIWLRNECGSKDKVSRYDGTPESKIFLMKLIREFAWQSETGVVQVRDLSARLGVSDKVIKSSIDSLQGIGLLKRVSAKSPLGGNSYSYKICSNGNPDYSAAQNISQSRYLYFQPLIDELLRPDTTQKENGVAEIQGRNKQHPLTLSNRLVLITLLAHSDPLGIVRGLSKAEICKLVGITPTRLRSQLSTLLREGYIINVIGGQTLTPIFGKVQSVLTLNLLNKNYNFRVDVTRKENTVLLYGSSLSRQILMATKERPVKSELLNTAISRFHQWQFDSNSKDFINVLRKYFPFIRDPYKRAILQSKIDQYASYCLNHYWHLIGSKLPPYEHVEQLLEFIADDCTKGGINQTIYVEGDVEEERLVMEALSDESQLAKGINDFILVLSWVRAEEIKLRERKAELDDSHYYQIQPSGDANALAHTLISRPKTSIKPYEYDSFHQL